LTKARGREPGPPAPLALARRPEDVGFLLGDADQDHALTLDAGGLGEVGLSDGLLALALLEVDDRDALVLGQLLDGGHELAGHLAEDLVAGDLLSAMLAEEPPELGGLLELGTVAVEEDAID
jgi:hypothetical protein